MNTDNFANTVVTYLISFMVVIACSMVIPFLMGNDEKFIMTIFMSNMVAYPVAFTVMFFMTRPELDK